MGSGAFDGGKLTEEFRGLAKLGGLGASGDVQYSLPEASHAELPAGTLFPTEHIRRLIAAAREHRNVVAHEVFDGSGPDGLTRVTAVIGHPDDEKASKEQANSAVRWPVSLAYYGAKGDDTTPQFELSFHLGDNGVLYDVVLDYGEFALKADLEQVDRYDPPACPQP